MNYPNNNYNFYPNNFNNMNSPYMNYNNQQGIMNQMGLNGKIVDSEEIVRVTEVPIGGYGVFPKADLSEVYIKTWNSNGTTSILTFKPVVNSKAPQEEEKTNNMLFSKIEELEAKINSFLEQKTTTSTSSGTVKRKEF